MSKFWEIVLVFTEKLSHAKCVQQSTMGKKCAKLPIQENLVITWLYTDWPTTHLTVHLHHRHTNVKKFNQQVRKPKCNSRFYLERNRMVARTFRKKKQQRSRVFFDVIWEKVLERVIENKRDEFCRKKNMKIQSGCETMRNASSQQGENERQWKIKANMNTRDKILGKHIRQFLHKHNV